MPDWWCDPHRWENMSQEQRREALRRAMERVDRAARDIIKNWHPPIAQHEPDELYIDPLTPEDGTWGD